jgi:hypothetical protein
MTIESPSGTKVLTGSGQSSVNAGGAGAAGGVGDGCAGDRPPPQAALHRAKRRAARQREVGWMEVLMTTAASDQVDHYRATAVAAQDARVVRRQEGV